MAIEVSNRHMKRWSTLLTIRETQIKTTKSYHLTPVRMASIKGTITNVNQRIKGNSLCTLGGNVNWCSHYGKTVWKFLKRYFALGIYLGEKREKTSWKIYMYPYVHCSIIYNSQDMKTT